jgi:hypothetical protein
MQYRKMEMMHKQIVEGLCGFNVYKNHLSVFSLFWFIFLYTALRNKAISMQQNNLPLHSFWKRQKIHPKGAVSCEDKSPESQYSYAHIGEMWLTHKLTPGSVFVAGTGIAKGSSSSTFTFMAQLHISLDGPGTSFIKTVQICKDHRSLMNHIYALSIKDNLK